MRNLSNVVMRLCAALLVLSAFAAPARADEASLEARLRAVEDEKAIRDVMVQYGQYLDTLDFKAYSELFAREGTWSGNTTAYKPVKGPAEIRATMEKAFGERKYDPEHITNVHLVTNVKIDVAGDRATGWSRWTVVTANEKDEPFVRLTGVYEDVFIREDGHWKFLSRVARRAIAPASTQ